jgi:hypothetical protein
MPRPLSEILEEALAAETDTASGVAEAAGTVSLEEAPAAGRTRRRRMMMMMGRTHAAAAAEPAGGGSGGGNSAYGDSGLKDSDEVE